MKLDCLHIFLHFNLESWIRKFHNLTSIVIEYHRDVFSWCSAAQKSSTVGASLNEFFISLMQQFSAEIWWLIFWHSDKLTEILLNSLRVRTNRSQLTFFASFRRAREGKEWKKIEKKESNCACNIKIYTLITRRIEIIISHALRAHFISPGNMKSFSSKVSRIWWESHDEKISIRD